MSRREYPADRWLAKGRWAYVWRIGACFAALMTAFWLIAAGVHHFAVDDPSWSWLLPNEHSITVTTFMVRVALNAVSGLLFGLVMYYLRPPASKAAV